MKLLRLTVRNFRIHREQTVEFDDRFTLVSGPNESGKSTLLEALNMAFFLRAKGNSAQHRAARSDLHAGHPQVEVAFRLGDRVFELQKTFSGINGTARLAERGAGVWQNDAADEKLAELLQTGEPGKLQGQWSHLLVAQRESGNDPVACANAQHHRLLQRLEEEGGGAAVISDRDSEVMRRVGALWAEWFTEGGKDRANAPLDRAAKEHAQAAADLAKALERWAQIEQADAAHADALRAIAEKSAAIAEVEGLLAKRRADAAQAAALRVAKAEQEARSRAAAALCASLAEAEARIAETRDEIAALDALLGPIQAAQKENDAALAQAEAELAKSAAECAAAREKAGSARRERDFADALLGNQQLAAQVAELEHRLAAIRQLREKRAEIAQAADKLPRVTENELRKLRALQQAVHEKTAALQATAARIRVLAAPSTVTVGDRTLEPGAEVLLTENAELRMGEDFRLLISPGGGSGIAETQKAAEHATAQLEATLHKLSVADLAGAEAAQLQRALLDQSAKALDQQLAEASPEAAEQSLAERKSALAEASVRLGHLRAETACADAPETLADATGYLETKRAAAIAADDALHHLETGRLALENRRANLIAARNSTAEKMQCASDKRLAAASRLQVLLDAHGDEGTRAAARKTAELAAAEASTSLDKTLGALADLGADTLDEDIKQLEEALAIHRTALGDAKDRRARNAALLHQDGTADPRGELLRAEAAAIRAGETLAAAKLRAGAIRRLHELFEAQRKELAEQFTAPLAEKIRFYLGKVFGAGLRVSIRLDGDRFGGIAISRGDFGDVPFEFGRLSGGAAEQVAAAVRLAIAELLAGLHGGSLPVVFDDAFTNSDPERILALQSMLSQAAGRGLQIILLSCNAADYRALPAKEVALSRNAIAGAPSGPRETPAGTAPDPDPTPPESANLSDHADESFLAALESLGGSAGNGALRERLGWSEAVYDTVKSNLIAAGRIETGRGRGGSVRIP